MSNVSETIDYDDDQTCTRPRAWFHAKQGLGEFREIRELMVELEGLASGNSSRGDPKLYMAAAIYAYLNLDRDEQLPLLVEVIQWFRDARDAREKDDGIVPAAGYSQRYRQQHGLPPIGRRLTPEEQTRENEAAARRDQEEADILKVSQCRLWEARDESGWITGYFITEPGNIHRPLAFILNNEDSRDDSLRLAKLVAGDRVRFAMAGQVEGYPVIDLHTFGLDDSSDAMPMWVYGKLCRPIEDSIKNPDRFANHMWPWCKFRIHEMKEKNPDAIEE